MSKSISPTHELSFFSFFINTQCSAAAQWMVVIRQMYCGGSVVGKASTVGPEISPTPPLIFIEGQKVRNLASFSTSLNFEPPAFENAARYSNSETKMQCCDDRAMSSPSLLMNMTDGHSAR